MVYQYQTQGVCSRLMNFELDENDRIVHLEIVGGCNGNLQGITALVTGQRAQDVIQRLSGIHCGVKATSCPDQLAQALKIALEKKRDEK